jgi:hypothetical protein
MRAEEKKDGGELSMRGPKHREGKDGLYISPFTVAIPLLNSCLLHRQLVLRVRARHLSHGKVKMNDARVWHATCRLRLRI